MSWTGWSNNWPPSSQTDGTGGDIVAASPEPRSAKYSPTGGRAIRAAAGTPVCFLVASRHGYLSFAGVITALYPAVIGLLAATLLREDTGWLTRAGLGLSVVCLALIAG